MNENIMNNEVVVDAVDTVVENAPKGFKFSGKSAAIGALGTVVAYGVVRAGKKLYSEVKKKKNEAKEAKEKTDENITVVEGEVVENAK